MNSLHRRMVLASRPQGERSSLMIKFNFDTNNFK